MQPVITVFPCLSLQPHFMHHFLFAYYNFITGLFIPLTSLHLLFPLVTMQIPFFLILSSNSHIHSLGHNLNYFLNSLLWFPRLLKLLDIYSWYLVLFLLSIYGSCNYIITCVLPNRLWGSAHICPIMFSILTHVTWYLFLNLISSILFTYFFIFCSRVVYS